MNNWEDYKQVKVGSNKTNLIKDAHGNFHYTLQEPLRDDFPLFILDKLNHWSKNSPTTPFLARRNQGFWEFLSYAKTEELVLRIASYFNQEGIHSNEGIAILSDNSFEHALVALASMYLGIPYSPVSPPYSLYSEDFNKLAHCLSIMRPKIIFVQNNRDYAKAIAFSREKFPEAKIISVEGEEDISWNTLIQTAKNPQIFTVHENLNPDAPAKILFTSGSTGNPKGVINSHRMWMTSLTQISQALAFMYDKKPIFLDWLPWNHTFGGNQNFGLTLYHGGTIYLDQGKPTEKLFGFTLENLKTVSPTAYFNVPKGFELLVNALEENEELCESFFKNLEILFYAGASLAQPIWDGLERLAMRTIGKKITMVTGLGCTEAGPSALFANLPGAFSGFLGVPVAGLDIKLVETDGKLEARYKGPNITQGYYNEPSLTQKSFDEEGYYFSGDAVKFLDRNHPDKGLVFDGRIAEAFKLSSGTWVNTGILKAKLQSIGSPFIQDAVLTGLDKDFIGAILFLSEENCRKYFQVSQTVDREELFNKNELIPILEGIFEKFNQDAKGSSNRIEAYRIAIDPPSIDKGEITDKGSINQRKVLENRSDLVNDIYQAYENKK